MNQFRMSSSIKMLASISLNNHEAMLTAIFVSVLIFLLKLCYNSRKKPPLAPGAAPVIGHSQVFLKDLVKLASIISYVKEFPGNA